MLSTPSVFTSLLVASVRTYQRTLSPDHGPLRQLWPAGVCRFTPTCSEYMIDALQQDGLRGISRGLRRLVHCHPYGGAV